MTFINKGIMISAINKRPENYSFKLSQLLILFFVFLFAMNFINRYFYCVFIAFIIFVFAIRKFTITVPFMVLLGLSISIMLFSGEDSSKITTLIKPLVYPLCFLMGSSFFNVKNKDTITSRENKISKIIYVVMFGLLVHYLLNFITNLGSDERNTIDFWVGGVLSATGQSALACIPIAVACCWLVSDSSKLKKFLSVLIILFILAYNLILAGRTIIIMSIICLATAIIHVIVNGKGVKKSYVLFTVLLIILGTILLINYNAFGLRDFVLESNLYERFFGDWAYGIDEDGRLDKKLMYLRNFFDNVWGGLHLKKEFGYAHDLYLDTYDYAGIFALIAVVIYMVGSIKRTIKIISIKSVGFNFKQLILCVFLIVNMEFFIEPILYGMPWLFASYCFIDGLLRSYINFNKRQMILSKRGQNENS